MGISKEAEALGRRIAALRDALKMSQAALAKAAGYKGQQSIAEIESGSSKRPGKLREIARALGTSQAYLLGETDDPAPEAVDLERGVVRVPVFGGSVSAGRLADTARDLPPPDREILVNDLGHGDFVAIPVRGDSMDRVSPEGSVIIINRREVNLQAGKPYVFVIRGDAAYKIWEPSPPRLEPFSWNPTNKPTFIDKKNKLIVVGRVRRTILDL